jgi:hypothetical protein
MYIFAKFVPDHIFLQNHDKLNIKNPLQQHLWKNSISPLTYGGVNT